MDNHDLILLEMGLISPPSLNTTLEVDTCTEDRQTANIGNEPFVTRSLVLGCSDIIICSALVV